MVVCQYIVAIAGTVAGGDKTVVKIEVALVCIYIFFFASTWYAMNDQQAYIY